VAGLTWENAIVVSITLALVGILYFFAALWRRWNWLLFPALVIVDLLVITILRIFFNSQSPWIETLSITYAVLGVVMTLGGAWLRHTGLPKWGWPLYIAGGINIVGSYLASFSGRGWISIGLSIVFASLSLWLAWQERGVFSKAKIPPLLSYLGAGLIFIGHLFVLEILLLHWNNWTAYTAGVCAVFIIITWWLRKEAVIREYGTPIHRAGTWLMLIPLVGSLVDFEPLLAAVSFGIMGVALAADAGVRRILRLGYLAGVSFLVVLWSLLFRFDVNEPQAYAIPLGLGLVTLGWSEKKLQKKALYLAPTILGMLVLMSTAFVQSLEGISYAVLLLIESLLAFGWGIRIHSRSFIELGVVSLVINGIAQLGPGFVELPRWVQLGVIGIILLGGGLTALFRRDQLLTTRKRMADEWRKWDQ
jgi:hypothetical protein